MPTLNINWCDLILASDGLFFSIGINDFEKNINLKSYVNLKFH